MAQTGAEMLKSLGQHSHTVTWPWPCLTMYCRSVLAAVLRREDVETQPTSSSGSPPAKKPRTSPVAHYSRSVKKNNQYWTPERLLMQYLETINKHYLILFVLFEKSQRPLRTNEPTDQPTNKQTCSRRLRRCEQNSQLAHDDCRQIRLRIWKLNLLRESWSILILILITFSTMTSLKTCVLELVHWVTLYMSIVAMVIKNVIIINIIMSSFVTSLNSSTFQEVVNWVTTATGAFTPPTRLNSTVESLRRRPCVLGLMNSC